MTGRTKQPWRKVLLQDWHRYSESSPSWRAVLTALIFNAGFLAVFLLRLGTALRERRWKWPAGLARRFNMIVSSNELSLRAEVEPGLYLPHPYGVTIGRGSRVGKDVTLYQGVVLGAKTTETGAGGVLSEYPEIGEGAVIYPHALVYGGIRVGDNSVILANSVVNRDIPPGATFGGAPAKEIRPGRGSSEAGIEE